MPRLPIESSTATTIVMHGRELLAFGGCNYLGLASEPEVIAAAAAGLARYGISTTASRETTGNTVSHEALEKELAAFIGQEAAILAAEGYTANFAACQGLSHEIGVALLDAKSHRSIRNAAMAAGMQVFEFEHLNAESAAWLVKQYADAGVAIMTDSVFAADGAIAPLDELLRLLPLHRSALLVDDCHGLCVLGSGGRGAVSHFNLDDPRICITTTLAKGLGCYGGAVLGRTSLVQRIRETSPVYRGSTPVPPGLAEAARAAVKIMEREPERVDRLRANIDAMRAVLTGLKLRLPPAGIPIFTFTLASAEKMHAVHERLLNAGVLAPLIDYPGGPGPLYFRVVATAAHSQEQIARLGTELAKAMR